MLRTLNLTILHTGALILALTPIYTDTFASERVTWLVGVTPVITVVPLLLATMKQYPLTSLFYTLVFLHAIIPIVGGICVYVKAPVDFQVQKWLDLSRGPYDELGHFFQGLVSVLTAREILVRGNIVRGHKMLAFLACCVAPTTSVMYEPIEWWVALIVR